MVDAAALKKLDDSKKIQIKIPQISCTYILSVTPVLKKVWLSEIYRWSVIFN